MVFFVALTPASVIARRWLAESAELERAIQLDPDNEDYRIRLAQRQEERGEDPRPAWRAAIASNPRRDLTLTQAAIASELAGDRAEAEAYLAQAVRYNQLWLPRWSLANYYYRHNENSRAIEWIQKALERAYGDRTAVFRLARDAGASYPQLAREIVPSDWQNQSSLVYFLVSEKALDELPPASERYLGAPRDLKPEDRRGAALPVLAASTALLEGQRVEDGVRLWNRLTQLGWVAAEPWRPEARLVNASLTPPFEPGGLDWQMPPVEGIESHHFSGGGLKFAFSGRQPEVAFLLGQTVVWRPGRRYELSFEYETRGIPPEQSGLLWTLTAMNAPAGLEPESAPAAISSEELKTARLRWRLPEEGPGVYRLRLAVTRRSGQTRIEGEFRLRSVSVKELD